MHKYELRTGALPTEGYKSLREGFLRQAIKRSWGLAFAIERIITNLVLVILLTLFGPLFLMAKMSLHVALLHCFLLLLLTTIWLKSRSPAAGLRKLENAPQYRKYAVRSLSELFQQSETVPVYWKTTSKLIKDRLLLVLSLFSVGAVYIFQGGHDLVIVFGLSITCLALLGDSIAVRLRSKKGIYGTMALELGEIEHFLAWKSYITGGKNSMAPPTFIIEEPTRRDAGHFQKRS